MIWVIFIVKSIQYNVEYKQILLMLFKKHLTKIMSNNEIQAVMFFHHHLFFQEFWNILKKIKLNYYRYYM